MKTCRVCGNPLQGGGTIVHVDCLLRAYSSRERVLAEIESRISALGPNLECSVNHTYNDGYRMGVAMAMNVIKDMQAGK